MSGKTYRLLAILSSVIALIGLLSFIGGLRSVNIGAFVIPLALAVLFWVLYQRKGRQ